jgi:hypothetical protein
MPVNFIKNGYKGYLEDRRPNSEGDPYQIVSRILHTINSVPEACAGHCLRLADRMAEPGSAFINRRFRWNPGDELQPPDVSSI